MFLETLCIKPQEPGKISATKSIRILSRRKKINQQVTPGLHKSRKLQNCIEIGRLGFGDVAFFGVRGFFAVGQFAVRKNISFG